MATYAGRQVLINIDTAGVGGAGATWAPITQQRGGTFNRTSDTADATHKDDNGWAAVVVTRNGWSISVDGALDPADSVLAYIDTQWKARAKVYVQFDASSIGGTKEEGRAVISNFSYEVPEGDLASYTLELQGDAALIVSP